MGHGDVFLLRGGREENHVGDVGNEGDVEETEVGDIVHAADGGVGEEEEGGRLVDTHVLSELVVGTLHEGGGSGKDGLTTALGDARSHGHGGLFGNADIDKLPAGTAAHIGCEAEE